MILSLSFSLVFDVGELVGRIECAPVVTMNRNQHDILLLLESMLGSVPMVNIPVHDGHFIGLMI